MRYATKKVEETTEKTNKINLQEAFVLWLHKGKKGVKYLSGHDLNDNKLTGFFNKKEKDTQPSIRVYGLNKDGSLGDEIATLWDSVSKDKKTAYATGLTNESEKLVGFFTKDETNEKLPYVRVYFK